jgi:hypothetical protein
MADCIDLGEDYDIALARIKELEGKLESALAELALANNYVRNTVELESRLGERDREIAANRRYIGEHIETIKSLETRLQSCELERDKYRAALMADRGEEAANRIRDEDRAFCLAHQTYFDSDIGCAKCNVVEKSVPNVAEGFAALHDALPKCMWPGCPDKAILYQSYCSTHSPE